MPPRRTLALGLAILALATLAALTVRAFRNRGAWLRARLTSTLPPASLARSLTVRLANRGETLVLVTGYVAEVWALDRDTQAPARTHDLTGCSGALFAEEADLALIQPRRAEEELSLVRLTTGELLGRFPWPSYQKFGAALSPSGSLAVARVDSAVEVRATRTGALVRTLPFAPGDRILTDSTVGCACAISPDESRVLLRILGAGSDNFQHDATCSLADGRRLGTVEGSVYGFTRSGDLFGRANGGPLAVWSPTGQKLRTAAESPPDDLPHGGLLVPTGDPPYRIVSERRGRTLLADLPSRPLISSDGRRAVLQRAGTIEVWDLDP